MPYNPFGNDPWNPFGGGGKTPWYRSGIPQPIAAYQAIGASSYAASKINLANPGTYDLVEGNAPSFATATGWAGDGIANYLKTGITCLQRSHSFMVRFSDVANTGYVCGWNNASGNRFTISPALTAGGVRYRYGSLDTNNVPVMVTGTLGIGNGYGWRNGIAETAQGVLVDGALLDIFIGCVNANGVPDGYIAGNILAVIVWATALTAAEMLKCHDMMMALTEFTPPF